MSDKNTSKMEKVAFAANIGSVVFSVVLVAVQVAGLFFGRPVKKI